MTLVLLDLMESLVCRVAQENLENEDPEATKVRKVSPAVREIRALLDDQVTKVHADDQEKMEMPVNLDRRVPEVSLDYED